jgi:hypothetical protein
MFSDKKGIGNAFESVSLPAIGKTQAVNLEQNLQQCSCCLLCNYFGRSDSIKLTGQAVVDAGYFNFTMRPPLRLEEMETTENDCQNKLPPQGESNLWPPNVEEDC